MTDKQWTFIFGMLRLIMQALILIVKLTPYTATSAPGKHLEREYFEFIEGWNKL